MADKIKQITDVLDMLADFNSGVKIAILKIAFLH